MKNGIKGYIAGILTCIMLMGVVFASNAQVREIFFGVQVSVNGEVQNFDEDMTPFIMDGRTFLPVRGIADALGVDVDFDAGANMVVLTSGAATYTPAPYVPTATGGLVGEWNWAVTNTLYYTFNADGSGIMFEDDIWWASRNGVLYVCITPDICGSMNDCILPWEWSYSISGNEMVLTSNQVDDMTFTYTRR